MGILTPRQQSGFMMPTNTPSVSDHSNGRPERRRRLRRLFNNPRWVLLIGVVTLCTAILAVTAALIREETENERHHTALRVKSLTRSLRDRVDADLKAPLFLARLLATESQQGQPQALRAQLERKRLEPLERQGESATGSIDAFTVVDEAGGAIWHSGTATPEAVVAKHLAAHARKATPVYISSARMGDRPGMWMADVSVRVVDNNGMHAGLVLAAVDMNRYQRAYTELNLGPGSVLQLLRPDGQVIVHISDSSVSAGQSLGNDPWTQSAMVLRAGCYTGTTTGSPDAAARISSFCPLTGYPLVAAVGMRRDIAMAGAERMVTRYRLIAALLLGLLAGGAVVMLTLLTRQQVMRQALRRSESRFRALSELGSDWYWETDARYRIVRISEGLLRLSGRAESEYLGKMIWELPFCTPTGSDWSLHQQTIAQQALFRDFCLRYLGPGGAVGYANCSGEPVFDENGEFAGYRGVGYDITTAIVFRQRMRMQYDVLHVLSKAESVEFAISSVIEIICRAMEWSWGARRHLDPDTSALTCHESWLEPGIEADAFVVATRQVKPVNINAGVASRAMLQNKVIWYADHVQGNLRRHALAAAANLRAAVAVPIIRGRKTEDALEFFSQREEAHSPVLRDTLEAIGLELGQFMDRVDAQQTNTYLEHERHHLLDRLQLQLNHMPVACILQNRNFGIDYCNPAAERIFGYTTDEMQGRDVVDFLVPEHLRAEVWARRARLQAGERNVTGRNENLTRDGRTIICEWNLTFLADEAGNFSGVLAVAQDVTERTGMIAALEDSEALFRQIFTAAPLPMLVAEVPTMRLLAANDAVVEKYGYSREELSRMTTIDLQVPEDRAQVAASILKYDFATTMHFERRHITHDGRTILAEVTAQPFRFGGQAARLIVLNDVTAQRQAQQALEESEARFRAMFEQASVGMGIREISFAPRWLRVNRKLCEILGYSEAELLQLTSVDITPESDRVETHEYNARLRAGELNNYSRKKRYQRKDGRIIWVELSVSVLNGPDGRPQSLISAVHDVTETVESQRLLAESEARYRQLFALTPLPMYLRRSDTLQFIEVNDACLATYGYTHAEWLSLTAIDIIVPEGRERFMREVQTRPVDAIKRFRSKHVRKNGDIFDVEVFVCSTALGEDRGWLALVIDITEQLHAEQLLRDSEHRVAMALDGSGGALFDWNVETGGLYFSEHWNVMRGGDAREIHTAFSALKALTHPEDWGRQHSAIIQMLKHADRPQHLADRIRSHAGDWIWVETRASVTERDARRRALRVQGIIIDVTQAIQAELLLREHDVMLRENAAEIQKLNADLEKRVEQRTHALAVANQELESFSYSVSHDLRAPLRSIDGFSQILLQEYGSVLDQTGRSYLERVRAGSQRMTRLIEDLLELSRVTRRDLQVRTCDLTALAWEVAQELQHAEPGRQVRITVADGLQATVDPGLLRIVLDNLLRNAWKFTSTRAEAVIEVGCTVVNGEPTYFVRDNGVGFDMTYVSKLFGAFQRLHSDAEFQGTGIGLALVQRVIRRHGGQVRAEGVPDGGATFYFVLPERREMLSGPVAKAAATATTAQPEPGAPRP